MASDTHSPQVGRLSEQRLLEAPGGRASGLLQAGRVFCEMIRGYRALHFVGPCVTIFGSARTEEGHSHYELAHATGAALARAGFTVMTGGGPGIMDAALRGAKEAGGSTVGVGIDLPMEQDRSAYADNWVEFRYFFVRKLMLVKYSYGFIAMPGGFGTLDEVFETATLIQTQKTPDFPLVLMGAEFWQPLLAFTRDTLLTGGAIDQADFDRFIVTDSPDEATALIKRIAIEKFGVRYAERARRRRWLFE